ncbi:Uncharacterised protein [Mycobacteroides abscessus subsp. massiliense]|nr:hypothetical protein [Mycobacteroides abscessus]SIN50369.1 Uncharacterised protein [Mycobacteroides abscessus subsp. bolletii]SLC64664.1 Uncharacterised protein [Mycobacteroides abscessus subsp. massiliense]MBE5430064.1 hypothetical protein [Mycobacteroides abscessus]MBE5430503.1 hypothetical protein [Mycobacteroides abscessus]
MTHRRYARRCKLCRRRTHHPDRQCLQCRSQTPPAVTVDGAAVHVGDGITLTQGAALELAAAITVAVKTQRLKEELDV